MLLNLSISSTSIPSPTHLLFLSLPSFPHLSHSPPLSSFLSDYLTPIPLFPFLSSIISPYFNHLLFSAWATSATTLCLEFPYRGYRAHWFIWKCFLSGTVLHNINSPSLFFFVYFYLSLFFQILPLFQRLLLSIRYHFFIPIFLSFLMLAIFLLPPYLSLCLVVCLSLSSSLFIFLPLSCALCCTGWLLFRAFEGLYLRGTDAARKEITSTPIKWTGEWK